MVPPVPSSPEEESEEELLSPNSVAAMDRDENVLSRLEELLALPEVDQLTRGTTAPPYAVASKDLTKSESDDEFSAFAATTQAHAMTRCPVFVRVKLREYFDRYDLDGSGLIDNTSELTLLATNIR